MWIYFCLKGLSSWPFVSLIKIVFCLLLLWGIVVELKHHRLRDMLNLTYFYEYVTWTLVMMLEFWTFGENLIEFETVIRFQLSYHDQWVCRYGQSCYRVKKCMRSVTDAITVGRVKPIHFRSLAKRNMFSCEQNQCVNTLPCFFSPRRLTGVQDE